MHRTCDAAPAACVVCVELRHPLRCLAEQLYTTVHRVTAVQLAVQVASSDRPQPPAPPQELGFETDVPLAKVLHCGYTSYTHVLALSSCRPLSLVIVSLVPACQVHV